MLDHCTYDKVKLLHMMSCLLWFIEKHGKADAKIANDSEVLRAMEELAKDLDRHIEKFNKLVCKK